MNGRRLKVLTAIAAILTVGELGSAVMIWRENYPGSLPWAAVMFAVFFGIATWLLRSGYSGPGPPVGSWARNPAGYRARRGHRASMT